MKLLSATVVTTAVASIAGCGPRAPGLGADDDLGLALPLGGPGEERALALVASPDGDALILGTAAGPLADEGPLASLEPGHFLARVRPDGAIAWARSLPVPSGAWPQVRLAADPAGGPVVAATVVGPAVDLGSGPLEGGGASDLLLARFDADGALVKALRFGGPGFQTLNGLDVDARGRVVLSGRFERLELPGRPSLRAAGREDGFVAAFDRELRPRWVHAFPSVGLVSATAVSAVPRPAERTAAVCAALRYEAPVAAAPLGERGRVTEPGVALVQLDAEGALTAARVLPDAPAALELVDVRCGADGELVAAGRSAPGTTALDPQLGPGDGGTDGVVLRGLGVLVLNPARLGGPGNDQLRALAPAHGRVWVTGGTEVGIALPGGRLEGGGIRSAFLARFDRDLRARYGVALRAQGADASYAAGLAPTRRGVWWWTGFTGAVTLGKRRFVSAGEGDLLLLRFEPS